MTEMTIELMRQRLTRGTPVIIADSFGKAELRGDHMIVTSKGPVDCNKGGRCAGDWCVGLAVFVADPSNSKRDKKMGWRSGGRKVCLTHLKDTEGNLVLPPPLIRQTVPRPEVGDEVSWADLAEAHRSGDLDRLAKLARRLKNHNEKLKTHVIDLQEELLDQLSQE